MTRRARGFRGGAGSHAHGGHFNVIVVMYGMSLVLNAVVMVSHVFSLFGEAVVPTQLAGGVYREAGPPSPGPPQLENKKVDVF